MWLPWQPASLAEEFCHFQGLHQVGDAVLLQQGPSVARFNFVRERVEQAVLPAMLGVGESRLQPRRSARHRNFEVVFAERTQRHDRSAEQDEQRPYFSQFDTRDALIAFRAYGVLFLNIMVGRNLDGVSDPQ